MGALARFRRSWKDRTKHSQFSSPKGKIWEVPLSVSFFALHVGRKGAGFRPEVVSSEHSTWTRPSPDPAQDWDELAALKRQIPQVLLRGK